MTLTEKVLFYANKLPIDIRLIFVEIVENIHKDWDKYNPKTGKYHWNYKGGISAENKLIRNSEAIKYWRQDVFNRDNYTCKKCNITGGILHAHHIKPFALFPLLRTDINNGITLCKKCHNKIHSKGGTNV